MTTSKPTLRSPSRRDMPHPHRSSAMTEDIGPAGPIPLPTTGMVGPFWVVEHNKQPVVLAIPVPLEQAVTYGDMLTVETGHDEYWSQLARQGAAALRTAGLPSVPVWSEYDEWPRGRVLYDAVQRHFVVRADQQLHQPALLALVATRFDIRAEDATVLPDEHYRSVRRISFPTPGPNGS